MKKPLLKPTVPYFCSGPTAKYPHWDPNLLSRALLSRSHRSATSMARLKEVIYRTRKILEIPDDYRIGLLPGSTTGAFEALMWSLLGPKGVEVLDWDVFSHLWKIDVVNQLNLPDVHHHQVPFGHFPDVSGLDPDRDVVFCWNGTTTGVAVPHGDWISPTRPGLTFCDATSAAFGMKLPWDKLDATAFSWQKCLGGEAQHGIVVLSPRAAERLVTHTPTWPVPRLFRMTTTTGINEDIFAGAMINTPSMMVVEDVLFALKWCDELGGLPALIRKTNQNAAVINDWVQKTSWVDYLAVDPSTRSTTSVCLLLTHPTVEALPTEEKWSFFRKMCSILEEEGAGYDLRNHIKSVPSLRVWCGPTVDQDDLKALMPWFEYAFHETLTLYS